MFWLSFTFLESKYDKLWFWQNFLVIDLWRPQPTLCYDDGDANGGNDEYASHNNVDDATYSKEPDK